MEPNPHLKAQVQGLTLLCHTHFLLPRSCASLCSSLYLAVFLFLFQALYSKGCNSVVIDDRTCETTQDRKQFSMKLLWLSCSTFHWKQGEREWARKGHRNCLYVTGKRGKDSTGACSPHMCLKASCCSELPEDAGVVCWFVYC